MSRSRNKTTFPYLVALAPFPRAAATLTSNSTDCFCWFWIYVNWAMRFVLFWVCFLLPKILFMRSPTLLLASNMIYWYCFYVPQHIHCNIYGHFGDFQFCKQLGIVLLRIFLCESLCEEINRFLMDIYLAVEPLAIHISRCLWCLQRVFQCSYHNLYCMRVCFF